MTLKFLKIIKIWAPISYLITVTCEFFVTLHSVKTKNQNFYGNNETTISHIIHKVKVHANIDSMIIENHSYK